MKQINLFIELTRLRSPIGIILLFWPCTWGLTVAYDFNGEITTYIKYLILIKKLREQKTDQLLQIKFQ